MTPYGSYSFDEMASVAATRTVNIKAEVLTDLASRFLINLSNEEREDPIKLCSHIELARWYYLDLLRPEDRNLPGCNFKEFMAAVVQHCPWLIGDSSAKDLDKLIAQWKTRKYKKPVRGAIILNPELTKGYPSGISWGFPKGKIEEEEVDSDAAVREVYEETGFDIRELIQEDSYLEANINDSSARMYIILGVPEDTKFEPKTRFEIKKIEWFKIKELPGSKKDVKSRQALGKPPNNFFTIIPFVGKLRKWLQNQKRNKTRPISATFKSNQEKEQSKGHPQSNSQEEGGAHGSASSDNSTLVSCAPQVLRSVTGPQASSLPHTLPDSSPLPHPLPPGHSLSTPSPHPLPPGHSLSTPSPHPFPPGHSLSTPLPHPLPPGHSLSTPSPHPFPPGHSLSTPSPHPYSPSPHPLPPRHSLSSPTPRPHHPGHSLLPSPHPYPPLVSQYVLRQQHSHPYSSASKYYPHQPRPPTSTPSLLTSPHPSLQPRHTFTHPSLQPRPTSTHPSLLTFLQPRPTSTHSSLLTSPHPSHQPRPTSTPSLLSPPHPSMAHSYQGPPLPPHNLFPTYLPHRTVIRGFLQSAGQGTSPHPPLGTVVVYPPPQGAPYRGGLTHNRVLLPNPGLGLVPPMPHPSPSERKPLVQEGEGRISRSDLFSLTPAESMVNFRFNRNSLSLK